jgi:acid phosphatase family membrane protein YuiD
LTGIGYALVCPLAYLLAGGTKLAINSVRAGQLALNRIGLGGFPSTHTAIVSSAAWLIALKDGINNPALAVAVGLVFVVIIDAIDLRRKIERVHHILKTEFPGSADVKHLRERMGHTPVEIAGGFVVGAVAALMIKLLGY